MRHGELHVLVAEVDEVLDVVARGIGGDAVPDLPAKQSVHRNAHRLPGDVPQGVVDGADGVEGQALAPVVEARAPHDVPEAFDLERVLAEEESFQVILDGVAHPVAADANAADALVGRDLDSVGPQVREERVPPRPVPRIDGHRTRHLDAEGRPGAGSRLVLGPGLLPFHRARPDSRDGEPFLLRLLREYRWRQGKPGGREGGAEGEAGLEEVSSCGRCLLHSGVLSSFGAVEDWPS